MCAQVKTISVVTRECTATVCHCRHGPPNVHVDAEQELHVGEDGVDVGVVQDVGHAQRRHEQLHTTNGRRRRRRRRRRVRE